MHREAYTWVEEQAHRHAPFEYVVEIGSRNINGSVRPLFGDAHYTGVDIQPGRGVDVIADGAEWQPSRDGRSPDCVVCCETLEHAERAREIVTNAGDMLRSGGIFIVTAATADREPHSGIDGGALREDEYYGAIDEDELLDWCEDAGLVTLDIVTDPNRGDIYLVAGKSGQENLTQEPQDDEDEDSDA